MRIKILIILTLSFCILSACKSEEKKEYDSAINQVIKLENEKLKREKKPIIKRTETGIVVFNKGELIRLYYYQNSKEINATYQKEETRYVLLPENKATFKKIDDAKEEYLENLGKK